MRFVVAAAAFAGALLGAVHADAQVTSNFGTRSDPFHGGRRMHAGMDMGGRVGMPIYATGDGYVRRSRWAGGYGNLIEIEHGYGYQTRFGHLSRSLVQEGQFVRRGQLIGLMGSTGRSTGPHLHYEVRISGRAVEPSRFMQIVFTQQPDWNAVRYSATNIAAAQPRSTATLAMAMVSRRRSSEDLRKVGDLEIDYGSGGAAPSRRVPASAFGGGHVSYGK